MKQIAADPDPRYLVPALVRGLDVLRMMSDGRRRMTLSDVAAALGITRSSAYRLLYTLSHLGFLVFDSAAKTYALGPQTLQLGYGFLEARDLVEVAMPHLVRLRDRTGWSAHLGELFGRDVVYLARIATGRSIASTVHVGTQFPAHATSMGRVLLAHLPPATLIDLYRDGRPGEPDAEDLRDRAVQDRQRGFVMQNSVFESGVASVAAPVKDMTGRVVAAINISVVAMFTNDAELNGALKNEVVAAADAISQELGFRGEEKPDWRAASLPA